MHRHVIACAALTLGCFVGTAAAQGQAPATTGSPKSSPSSTAPQSSSATKDASHADALAALQDARVTLSRLTEASMPQDARQALATVSTGFRGLYKAYTGEEPAPQKTAQQ